MAVPIIDLHTSPIDIPNMDSLNNANLLPQPDTNTKPGPTNVQGAGLFYNEYIAYDIAQVKMRYLLRVKM